MRHLTSATLVGLLLLPAICLAQPPVTPEVVIAAFEAQEAEAVAAIHTEDVVVLAPGAPPIKTRTALQAYYQQAAEVGIPGIRNLEVDEIIELGEYAFVRGTYDSVRGEESTHIVYSGLLRLVEDRWLAHRVMSFPADD